MLGVLRQYTLPLLLAVLLHGLAVGALSALAVASWTPLSEQLYRTSAMDPPTYLGVAALLLVVSIVASFMPARRAVRVEPMAAMRLD